MDAEEVGNAVDRADAALAELGPDASAKMRERLTAWSLRIKGYSIYNIADELHLSVGAVHADIKWCLANLPAAYESTESFRHMAMDALDEQLARLQSGRNGEPPTDTAERVIVAIRDMQAKLLGAYAPTKVDASVKTQYEVLGIEADKL